MNITIIRRTSVQLKTSPNQHPRNQYLSKMEGYCNADSNEVATMLHRRMESISASIVESYLMLTCNKCKTKLLHTSSKFKKCAGCSSSVHIIARYKPYEKITFTYYCSTKCHQEDWKCTHRPICLLRRKKAEVKLQTAEVKLQRAKLKKTKMKLQKAKDKLKKVELKFAGSKKGPS